MQGITKWAKISWLRTALDYYREFIAMLDIACKMLRMQRCWLFAIFEHMNKASSSPFLTNYSAYSALSDEAMQANMLEAAALKFGLPCTDSRWKQKPTRLWQLNKSARTCSFSELPKQQNALRMAPKVSSLRTNTRYTSRMGIRIDMTFPLGKTLAPLISNIRTNR